MDAFDEETARQWCLEMTSWLPRRQVIPRDDNQPYLTRYFVAGWHPAARRSGPAVFLHHFVASDASDQVHSHPWHWGASVILAGGYLEYRCDETDGMTIGRFEPGMVNILRPGDKHRIELLAADCWTLFLAGQYAQPWSFSPVCD